MLEKLVVKTIMNGLRVISLIYKNASVLDSMLTQMSLSNTVKMLGLEENMSKGYFPYEFTNLNYVGPIPPKEMFKIDKFDENELEKFNEQYDNQQGKEYVVD